MLIAGNSLIIIIINANGILSLPIVVRTEVAKNSDCPKLQFGTLELFFVAVIPALCASITASRNRSNSSSENKSQYLPLACIAR